MAEPTIRLDKSRPYGENRGEMTPEDPLYHVHYWQGGKMGGKIVLLPFDSQGNLVPDDGKTAPWRGRNAEGKEVEYHPLYNAERRAYLDAKKKKMASAAVPDPNEIQDDEREDGEDTPLDEEVNFESWLRGQAKYPVHLLREAAKKRFSRTYPANDKFKMSLIEDLVLDERLVPEDQVCAELARYLPKQAAA